MDANKLKVLQEVGYRINSHCGICRHADLSKDGWGYCGVHFYNHLKHSEERSRLSINRMGSCPRFELDEQALAVLGLHQFAQFLKDT